MENLTAEQEEQILEDYMEKYYEHKDEGFNDFMYWNKSDLLKEFAELFKCDKENVEDYYPDDFNKFCRDAYEETKDIGY